MIAQCARLSRIVLGKRLSLADGLPIVQPMHITGNTRVFMILGDPVAQVRAPELFNALFRRHGLDAVLVPARVPVADVQAYVQHAFLSPTLGGLWLTIPHKTPVWRMLQRCDRLGTVAQSVNAVRRAPDGALEGALFDGLGFVGGLDHLGVRCRGARVLVVGVGGAGAAIAVSLAERGVRALALHDTDVQKCKDLAPRITAAFGTAVLIAPSADPAGFDLVVNATPLGLHPDDPLPFDPARLDAGAAVVDILMKPRPTPLLAACASRGLKAWPGLEMMIQQAPSYLDFFGFNELSAALRHDATEIRALLAPQQT
jgi:shikimate dehydrogenase